MWERKVNKVKVNNKKKKTNPMIKQEIDLTSHLFTRQIIYLPIECTDNLKKKKKMSDLISHLLQLQVKSLNW